MAVDAGAPPTNEETNVRKASLSKWMSGLKEALPSPSIGAGSDAPTDPDPQPPQAAALPGTTPAVPKPAAQSTEPKPEPEPKPEVRAEAGEEKWPRSAKEWKNFTTSRKAKDEEYKTQIAERDTRIKELEARGTPAIPPEAQKQIESLKKENEEYSKQLRLAAVSSHPKFKQWFESKTNATLAQLKSCVPADQLESVTKLVQEPDSDIRNEKINTMLVEMNPLQQGRFISVLNSLWQISAEREGEISKASQDYDQMMGQAKAQREAQQASFSQLLEGTVKTMQDGKNGRPEYQLREGETEWNTTVQKRIDMGKQLITGNLAPEVMFKAAFDAAAYPDVLASYRGALGEIDKLKKQITAMSAANPTVLSPKRAETNGTGTEPAMPKDPRPMDFTKQWVKKFGDAMRGE